MTKTLHAQIPATSANVGSGFDAVGIALTLYNDIYFTEEPDKDTITVEVEGLGANTLPRDFNDNMVGQAMKAVAIKNDNSVVLTYLGFAINAKASAINGNVVEQKKLYTESMGFLEQAKTIDPNRAQSNWAYPLYQCYYTLYGADDSRTKELEGMLKK